MGKEIEISRRGFLGGLLAVPAFPIPRNKISYPKVLKPKPSSEKRLGPFAFKLDGKDLTPVLKNFHLRSERAPNKDVFRLLPEIDFCVHGLLEIRPHQKARISLRDPKFFWEVTAVCQNVTRTHYDGIITTESTWRVNSR